MERLVRVVNGQGEGAPSVVLRLADQGVLYLDDALAQIDNLGIRFSVDGNANWHSILDTEVTDEIRKTRRFEEADIAYVGSIGDIPNRGGQIGEIYSPKVFERLGLRNPLPQQRVGNGLHFVDYVYLSGSKKIPVEVKNYTSAGSFQSAWDIINEVSKARTAKLEYGNSMEVYVFHFTDDKIVPSVINQIKNRFATDNILKNVNVIIIYGKDTF